MKITFLPKNIICDFALGMTVLEAATACGVDIDGNCSGAGTCGKCKVKVLSENSDKPDEVEKRNLTETEKKGGFRLACRYKPSCDLVVEVSMADGAANRKTKMIDLPDWFINKEHGGKGYGIAFDIGTTTVAAMLWNLENTELMDIKAVTNPQSVFGTDVISRITYAGDNPTNLEAIHKKIVDCLNALLEEFAAKHSLGKEDISGITVVGNTTMSHLFAGVDPAPLAAAPFTPAFLASKRGFARDFGVMAGKDTWLYLLPNIAGHVGSDITAGILATNIMNEKKNNLFVDIGTNGEIVLSAKGRTLTCSTAAGPAFEGAAIYQGMRAASGAIERVTIQKDDVDVVVIDGLKPRGICGSGIIDAVAQLVKNKIIDKTGKFAEPENLPNLGCSEGTAKRLRINGHGKEFVLAYVEDGDDIVITQKDVREVQLAKAAIYAGIKILMKELSVDGADLDRVSIAGAFGSYIDKESALIIGLLPEISIEKIVSVGNAAGVGASLALLSGDLQNAAEKIASGIEHLELADYEGFQDEYLGAMSF